MGFESEIVDIDFERADRELLNVTSAKVDVEDDVCWDLRGTETLEGFNEIGDARIIVNNL